ncbi:family 43 glycosylhydrolase [Streptomyces sp. ME02-6979-3A]|uniref:family 43 glycosylhydrolase n=1 Tax=unclassified Streptomyces TaxID=2593676 RepID=UPI0029B93981|nr:family 43 glycosylhydrolase [Streptomyces sp. ME02-6979-3A]MDX3329674.1 family 43 glycosylhydrolase [Streptomyces sp. ME02-6979-3A]
MRRTRRTAPSRSLPRWAAAAAALVWLVTLASAPSHGAPSRPEAPRTYTNPVSAGAVDTFPDPAMIRGKDGLWYAYGTQNPVMQSKGEDGERMLPVLRSADMVTWEYAGEVFTPENKPAWHEGSRLWAPEVRYARGLYHLYYSVPGRNTVGLATSATPTGPWTDRGAVLPTPSGCPAGNIDQAQFTDTDGTPYLYWGSYDTICVAKLNADLSRTEGEVTQVARGRRVEGGFVVRRDDFYYLFYSDAGCCDGAYSGYQVKVGRSTSPTGPFTDDEGTDLMALTSKVGVVVGANGNRWIGPGHNSLQTDLAGQDWLVYHGIPAESPDLAPASNGTLKLTRRPMLIDRLDWIDGWPVVRAGAGPSDGPTAAPVTSWAAGGTFNDGGLSGWHAEGEAASGWSAATGPDARGHAVHTPGASGAGAAYLVAEGRAPADLRAEADLRVTAAGGAAGLTVAYRDPGNRVVAWLDRARGALVTDVRVGGRSRGEQVTALPSGFSWNTWNNVSVELRGTRLTAEVTGDRLRDPVATQSRVLPAAAVRKGAVGAAARGAGAAADNVGAAALYRPVTKRVALDPPGRLLREYSDEFSAATVPGTGSASRWRWVRGPAAGVTMSGGSLSWPTQDAELHLGTNTASVLLRDAPKGDFTVETKMRFAPGQAAQQAGLVLYENDDRWFKLVHSVLPLTNGDGAVLHVSEFGKEGERPTTTPPTAVANAPMFGGPPADTMWLRMAYHRDTAHGEHEVRASTSRDGVHWSVSGVWTLPVRGDPRIGLVSHNRSGATAEFDYVRTYAAP